MNNKKISAILLLIILSFLVGCTSSQFESNYKQFKDSYILATDFIEKDNDSLKALKKMDVNLVETELNKMKGFMDKMNTKTKDEKGIYGNVKNYYEGLEFLLKAAKNFDKLSIDEKLDVDTEIIIISTNRRQIKAGEV